MTDDRETRRRALKHNLVTVSLALVSLVVSFAVRVENGDLVPWGLVILAVLVACVGYLAHLTWRLRRLG